MQRSIRLTARSTSQLHLSRTSKLLPLAGNAHVTDKNSIYFFAVYSAIISYAALYHWNDIKLGFVSLWESFKKNSKINEFKDVHTKLMEQYKEVPEWWYLILNVSSLEKHSGID